MYVCILTFWGPYCNFGPLWTCENGVARRKVWYDHSIHVKNSVKWRREEQWFHTRIHYEQCQYFGQIRHLCSNPQQPSRQKILIVITYTVTSAKRVTQKTLPRKINALLEKECSTLLVRTDSCITLVVSVHAHQMVALFTDKNCRTLATVIVNV